jgi:hypothetical protein
MDGEALVGIVEADGQFPLGPPDPLGHGVAVQPQPGSRLAGRPAAVKVRLEGFQQLFAAVGFQERAQQLGRVVAERGRAVSAEQQAKQAEALRGLDRAVAACRAWVTEAASRATPEAGSLTPRTTAGTPEVCR